MEKLTSDPVEGAVGGTRFKSLPPQSTTDITHGELVRMVTECQAEIEKLKKERNVLSIELKDSIEKQFGVQGAILTYQGMLNQFSLPKVRKKFLAGKYVQSHFSPDVLEAIDCFQRILLPDPADGEMGGDHRVQFLGKLFSRDNSEPQDEGGAWFPYRRRFSWWRDFFEVLMHSANWKESGEPAVKPKVRLVSTPKEFILNEDSSTASSESFAASDNPSAVKSEGFGSMIGGFGKKTKVKKLKIKREKVKKERVSEREYHSSSSESSGGQTPKSKALDGSGMSVEAMLLRALESLGGKKEVIAPQSFNPSDGKSLKSFLASYERYFAAKFEGTDKEKGGHLAKFLKGSALSAYNAIGGADMRYSKLKPRLMKWYGSQLTDLSDTIKENFLSAVRHSGETCAIYCLRLETLATAAFTESPRELERQLKRKLKETVPHALRKQIENAESIFSVTEERSLSWKKVKKLTEQYDKKAGAEERDRRSAVEENLSVFLSDSSDRRMQSHRHGDNGSPQRRQRQKKHRTRDSRVSWVNSNATNPARGDDVPLPQRPNNRYRSNSGPPVCNHCKRTGHTEPNCWILHKRCFGCGSPSHLRAQCPGQGERNGRLFQQRDLTEGRERVPEEPLNSNALMRPSPPQSQ